MKVTLECSELGLGLTPNGSVKDRESQVKGDTSKEEYEEETRLESRLSKASVFQGAL